MIKTQDKTEDGAYGKSDIKLFYLYLIVFKLKSNYQWVDLFKHCKGAHWTEISTSKYKNKSFFVYLQNPNPGGEAKYLKVNFVKMYIIILPVLKVRGQLLQNSIFYIHPSPRYYVPAYKLHLSFSQYLLFLFCFFARCFPVNSQTVDWIFKIIEYFS